MKMKRMFRMAIDCLFVYIFVKYSKNGKYESGQGIRQDNSL